MRRYSLLRNLSPALAATASACLCALLLAQASQADATPDQLPMITVAGKTLGQEQTRLAMEKCRRYFSHLGLQQCLTQYWAPRFMLNAEADARKLEQVPSMQHALAQLTAAALAERIEESQAKPSPEAVEKFVSAHPRDFRKPLRLRIFRLLTASEQQAKELLEQLKSPVDLKTFRALCREHSIDKATHERGGDLGFVWPDGSTDVPQVSVETSLYQAALALKDGELAPTVVPEGDRFAIVWRRGSLPALENSDDARAIAAARLSEQNANQELDALIKKLSAQYVKNRADVLLGKLRRKDSQLFQEP